MADRDCTPTNEMKDASQLDEWRGKFGRAYIERNLATPERVEQRARAFSTILAQIEEAPPTSIVEVGANVGLNLRALQSLLTADLFAVEPNGKAREVLIADGVLPASQVFDGAANEMPLKDASVDMVLTSTVLIHVPDETLEASYREIFRVAKQYILCLEYFSPDPVTVHYRGRDDMLFKRDYGSLWLDWYPTLEFIADGFFWKRTTGLDNVNWWLFRKT
jgi:pseudaminic acid biosynthesis-associated methylase